MCVVPQAEFTTKPIEKVKTLRFYVSFCVKIIESSLKPELLQMKTKATFYDDPVLLFIK